MTQDITQRIRLSDGEELLLLAIVGDSRIRAQVDAEIDRRARLSKPQKPPHPPSVPRTAA